MMKNLYYISIFLFSFYSFGQESRTTIGRSYLLVGQQTTLTYMVKMDGKANNLYQPFSKFLKANRLKENGQVDSKEKIDIEIVHPFHDTLIKLKSKEKMWIGSYIITFWDSGFFELPKSTIQIDDKIINLNSIIVKVDLVPSKKGQSIYGIKDNFIELPSEPIKEKIKRFLKENKLWLIVVIGLLLLGLIYFILKRIKKETKEIVEPIIELSAKEKALNAIIELEKQKLWEKGKLKTHYIELSHILRVYLSEVFEIHLLEKTTTETKLLLAQKGIEQSVILKIEEVLVQSDMVKFAKSTPDELTILSVSANAKQIIQSIGKAN